MVITNILSLFFCLFISFSHGAYLWQPHLSFTSDDLSKRTVMWYTSNPSPKASVEWWIEGDKKNLKTVTAYNSSTYSYGNGTIQSGWHQRAIITGLAYNSRYKYRVSDGVKLSPAYTFKTGPPQTDIDRFTFAIYGDHGLGFAKSGKCQNGISHWVNERLFELAANGTLDCIYHVGDISYASSRPKGEFENSWNEWFMEMSPAFNSTPLMVCPGNHESYSPNIGYELPFYHEGMDDGCDCRVEPEKFVGSDDERMCTVLDDVDSGNKPGWNFTAYHHRFAMPDNGVANMWYSWDYGPVHFTSINTETDYPNAPEDQWSGWGDQLTWVEKDLKAAAENEEVKFIVVVGHKPIYSHAPGYSTDGVPIRESIKIQAAFEALFRRYKVDLYFVGHQHGYESTKPMFNNTVMDEGTIYVVSGMPGGGCCITANWTSPIPEWINARWPDSQPEVFELEQEEVGFGLLNLIPPGTDGRAKLTWNFYDAYKWEVKDSFDVFQKNRESFRRNRKMVK